MGYQAMTAEYDVVVVGGGIVGAACGAACARGGLKVLLLERDLIGGGATATCMGHVVVMDDSEAQLALTAYSRRLWHDLAEELPAALTRVLAVVGEGTAGQTHAHEHPRRVKTRPNFPDLLVHRIHVIFHSPEN